LSKKISDLGLKTEVVTTLNVSEVFKSESVRIYFISPEMLKTKAVIHGLMSVRNDFVIKCVDEAHLFLNWGIVKKKGRKAFRPAMKLSTGELASLGGITVLQTATATSRSMHLLQEEFPEITSWKKIINNPFRSNITLIIPPPHTISSKFQNTLEPFIKRMLDLGENHLILVRSINSGSEMYFHLVKRFGTTSEGKSSVAFYHRFIRMKIIF
jgi:superfamily II DNA helicase RecQ